MTFTRIFRRPSDALQTPFRRPSDDLSTHSPLYPHARLKDGARLKPRRPPRTLRVFHLKRFGVAVVSGKPERMTPAGF